MTQTNLNMLDVAGHLPLRQPVVLPLQPHVQRGHGQVIQPLVGLAVLAAPIPVRRQRAHQLLDAAAEQDEVGGALADQPLRIVELTARRLPARELVVELPGARQGAVRPCELGGLPARPAKGQNLRAQPRGPWPKPGWAARRICSRCCAQLMVVLLLAVQNIFWSDHSGGDSSASIFSISLLEASLRYTCPKSGVRTWVVALATPATASPAPSTVTLLAPR